MSDIVKQQKLFSPSDVAVPKIFIRGAKAQRLMGWKSPVGSSGKAQVQSLGVFRLKQFGDTVYRF